jgi:hypothetical protein
MLRLELTTVSFQTLIALSLYLTKMLGEYDFQLDIQALLVSARDGHLSYNGDVVRIFVFTRTLPLVSVSTDGFQIPQIYAQGNHTLL